MRGTTPWPVSPSSTSTACGTFGRFGSATLTETVIALVDNSEAGMTPEQLQKLLRVEDLRPAGQTPPRRTAGAREDWRSVRHFPLKDASGRRERRRQMESPCFHPSLPCSYHSAAKNSPRRLVASDSSFPGRHSKPFWSITRSTEKKGSLPFETARPARPSPAAGGLSTVRGVPRNRAPRKKRAPVVVEGSSQIDPSAHAGSPLRSPAPEITEAIYAAEVGWLRVHGPDRRTVPAAVGPDVAAVGRGLLTDSFLDGLAAAHQARLPALRAQLEHGGYAHLDGCEPGTDVLFAVVAAPRRWTLPKWYRKEIGLNRCVEKPAIMRDLRTIQRHAVADAVLVPGGRL